MAAACLILAIIRELAPVAAKQMTITGVRSLKLLFKGQTCRNISIMGLRLLKTGKHQISKILVRLHTGTAAAALITIYF